jgi:hypothetical protein
MESSWHAINDMDFSKGAADRKAPARPKEALTEKERSDILNQKEPGFWTWKKAGMGVGVLAMVGVGAAFLLPDKPASSGDPDSTLTEGGLKRYGIPPITEPK